MAIKFDYTGRVALVTGSGSGIGAGIALAFARAGAQVVVTDRYESKVAEVAAQCDKASPSGSKMLQVVADLTKEDDAKRLVNETMAHFGKMNVLVNCAGVMGRPARITDKHYMEVYHEVMEHNLTSLVYMTHLCVAHLTATKGNIVNISSVNSTQALEGFSSMCMTKAAIDMFTKCMAIELGPNIRVNAINPGIVKTPLLDQMGMTKEQKAKFLELYAKKYPVGRVGEPEDIANTVLFVASDASSFTTGSIIAVDGGHLAASAKVTEKDLI